MSTVEKPLHVGILGAGLSGLALHHYLKESFSKANRPIVTTLIEAGPRVGGVIQSEAKDGFLLEHGPDCFITDKPQGLELCNQLGLETSLRPTIERYRKSYIARGDRLHPVPEGLYLMAPTQMAPFLLSPLVSVPGKIRALAEPWIRSNVTDEDESLASFVRRRFGQEMLDRVAQPMIAGIYSGDPEKLSLRSTMPRFLEMEKKHGSVLRGFMRSPVRKGTSGPRYSLFMSLREGMSELTSTLLTRSHPTRILLNTSVRSVESLSKDRWAIRLDGETLETDALCVCTPGHETFGLVEPEELDFASIAILHFAFESRQIRKPFGGMGFVVPSVENRNIIACSFLSHKFENRAPQGFELLRVFCGGKLNESIMERSDDEILASAAQELSVFLGIEGMPQWTTIRRWNRRMPQYNLGHEARARKRRDKESRYATAFFTGNYVDGVGIPDVVRNAKTTAERVLGRFTRP